VLTGAKFLAKTANLILFSGESAANGASALDRASARSRIDSGARQNMTYIVENKRCMPDQGQFSAPPPKPRARSRRKRREETTGQNAIDWLAIARKLGWTSFCGSSFSGDKKRNNWCR